MSYLIDTNVISELVHQQPNDRVTGWFDRVAPDRLHVSVLTLGELRKDEVVQAALGVIYDEFVALKASEWAEYHAQVSKWEVDRYLTMF